MNSLKYTAISDVEKFDEKNNDTISSLESKSVSNEDNSKNTLLQSLIYI